MKNSVDFFAQKLNGLKYLNFRAKNEKIYNADFWLNFFMHLNFPAIKDFNMIFSAKIQIVFGAKTKIFLF